MENQDEKNNSGRRQSEPVEQNGNQDMLFPSDMSLEGLSESDINNLRDVERQYQELRDSGNLPPEAEAELRQAAIQMAGQIHQQQQQAVPEGVSKEESRNIFLRLVQWIIDLLRRIYETITGRQRDSEKDTRNHDPRKEPQPRKANLAEGVTNPFKNSLVNRMASFMEENPDLKEEDPQSVVNAFQPPQGAMAAPGRAFGFAKGSPVDMSGLDDNEFDPNQFDDFHHDEENFYAVDGKGLTVSAPIQEVIDEAKASVREKTGFNAKINPDDIMDTEFANYSERGQGLGYSPNSVEETPSTGRGLGYSPDSVKEAPSTGRGLGYNPDSVDVEDAPVAKQASFAESEQEQLSQKAKGELWAAQMLSQMKYDNELMNRLAGPSATGDKPEFDEEFIYGAHSQLALQQQHAVDKVANNLIEKGQEKEITSFLSLVETVDLRTLEGVDVIRNSPVVKKMEVGVNGEPNRDLSSSLEEMRLSAQGAQAIRQMEFDGEVMGHVNDRIREDSIKSRQVEKVEPILDFSRMEAWKSSVFEGQASLLSQRKVLVDKVKNTWEACTQKDPDLDNRYFDNLIAVISQEQDPSKLLTLINSEAAMEVLSKQDPTVGQTILDIASVNIAMKSLASSQPGEAAIDPEELLQRIATEGAERVQTITQSNAPDQGQTVNQSLLRKKTQLSDISDIDVIIQESENENSKKNTSQRPRM